MSQYERDMIALAKAHSTKVIVLINANNPMEIEELKADSEIDAILWVGESGIYGFYGVADVLAGNANPSGHLPDTWAVNSTSAPAMRNFGLYLYQTFQRGFNAIHKNGGVERPALHLA
ncbi:MAG: glycoside hydrolase family 3 C-terminal domain-containing protein [Oscillibacter sp.]|nr:glycoside hydrolase family 3 C-terminal domain-containing protein [Oscillibacter sp.]